MLAINMADVVNVLNTCKPYLIGFGVVFVIALIVIIAAFLRRGSPFCWHWS